MSSTGGETTAEEVTKASHLLPLAFSGRVVSGFGRGGKELGCPTANLDEQAIASLPSQLPAGVYWGTGRVNRGESIGFVMSIGFNPHYGNTRKTMEVHFLRKMDDFYGSEVDGTIHGFLRGMQAFAGLDQLIAAIEADKRNAQELLSKL